MDKTVLITGAAGGIGQAIAKRFAAEGYQVVLHYNTNSEGAMTLKKTLEKTGANVFVSGADLKDPAAVDRLLEALQDHHIHVDVLINNAGIKADGPIDEMADATFTDVLRTNVEGPWFLIKRLVPAMKEKGFGRIINITSGVAKEGRANQTNYAASKAALENLSKSLARELGPYGITANAVAPGLIMTPMTADVPEAQKEAYIDKVPIKRLVEAEDVAHACAFFADERSGAISGQIIGVNGGLR